MISNKSTVLDHALLQALCCALFLQAIPATESTEARPLMRDFMGINGHYHFKPELYRPTCSHARNYHPMVWDIPDDTSVLPDFPLSRQVIDGSSVDWSRVYGSWKQKGFRVNASLQFESIDPGKWKNAGSEVYEYGKAFAAAFGPSSSRSLVEAAEVGNEPAKYDDAAYRLIFENMAKGIRRGDPKMKIVTAATMANAADEYCKNIEILKGLESLYDVINMHTYSAIEYWPTWRRVYPEHPEIPYLKIVRDMVAWRNKNTPGKEIWVTEFGYDASTKTPTAAGGMEKWVSSTETEQAQWIVRSYLLFSSIGVQRAYVYYYNDEDKPSFHASSGITRNFVPKPAYWAMAHMNQTLGDYHFSRIVSEKPDDLFIFEYMKPGVSTEAIWVIWSPTGDQKSGEKTISVPGVPVKARRMPLKENGDETVDLQFANGTVRMRVEEAPTYLWLKAR